MTNYTATTTFGSFRFQANFADAASPIMALGDNGNEDFPTPYQVADARHSPKEAAVMLLRYFGRDYWCDPSVVSEDEDGNETFEGMTENEYIRSLIEAVEAE